VYPHYDITLDRLSVLCPLCFEQTDGINQRLAGGLRCKHVTHGFACQPARLPANPAPQDRCGAGIVEAVAGFWVVVVELPPDDI